MYQFDFNWAAWLLGGYHLCFSLTTRISTKNENSTKYGRQDIWGVEQNVTWHLLDNVKRAKDMFAQVIQIGGDIGCSKFLSCPLCGSMPIWWICFKCVINTSHEVTMCHTPCAGQYIKGQIQAGSLKLFRVCSVAPCLFAWNVKGHGDICHSKFCCVCSVVPCLFDQLTSHVAQIWTMNLWCATHHFKVKIQKFKVQGNIGSSKILLHVHSVAWCLFTRGQFWPSGIAIACICLCVRQSVRQSWACLRDIPWICYERNFSEFYLSIWNQLIFNQRLQLFVQSPQPYLLVFVWRK